MKATEDEHAAVLGVDPTFGSDISRAPLASPPPGLPVVDDAEFATQLATCFGQGHFVLIVVNGYAACAFKRPDSLAPWAPLCCGDFSQQSIEVAKSLIARKRLAWSTTENAPWAVDPATVPVHPATVAGVRSWIKAADKNTVGREGDAPASVKEEVARLAAWRCQFPGCGRDLRTHTAIGTKGRFSYFAHIVAASKDGPRGDPARSAQLAAEPTNLLLLCDECHREIDRVNPARYSVEVLCKMREDSIAEVQRLLDTLRYPAARVIAIIGNITGQPGHFGIEDLHEALWASRLRSEAHKVDRFFNPGGQHHQVHSGGYWESLFAQLRLDLPALQALVNGTRASESRPRLAVFPLHGTSVLVLAGCVLGDNSGVHLFQPHRNTVGQGTRWAWPTQGAGQRTAFRLEEAHPHAGQDEAVLTLELTSEISAARMPTHCAADGRLLQPTLRITGRAFDKDCIAAPEDLQQLGLVIDAALQRLQDEWGVRKVHLFVSAPTTAVVTLGQKLQARHRADFICYESFAGPGAPYQPTIEITSTTARELVSGRSITLSLQP